MGLEDEGGQAAADPEGTTAEAPTGTGEQSVALSQTTDPGSDSGDVESFFDPKSIEGKPELQSAYKQMQGEFTKRLQGIAEGQTKIDAYNAFEADPLGYMQGLATQYGWNVIEGGKAPDSGNGEFSPSTWAEVEKHFLDKARNELRKEFAPLTNEVKDLKKQNVESQLDKDHPDWRTYESQMRDMLQRHPTLVNDPEALYNMAVPKELIEQRATKAALAKIKGGTDNAAVGDNKTTSIPTTDKPTKSLSFDEAVTFAKAKLGKAGITAPVGEEV